MGVVYLVHDHERSADVALKTIPAPTAGSIYRFKQEFRGLADLSHPNLADLYELFADGEQNWFFTMEYVDGIDFLRAVEPTHDTTGQASSVPQPTQTPTVTLARETETATRNPASAARLEPQRAAPAGPVEPSCDLNRLRAVLRQVADGLVSLHAAGMLHRDIKPSNIMVDHHGRVVILDFGLVLEMEAADEFNTDALAGTPAYMSPEQAVS